MARLDRIIADAPRIWALGADGKLTFDEEVRGLFNQIMTAGMPTLGDRRDYVAGRAKGIQIAGPSLQRPAWASHVHVDEENGTVKFVTVHFDGS